jgi:hypothetical protein
MKTLLSLITVAGMLVTSAGGAQPDIVQARAIALQSLAALQRPGGAGALEASVSIAQADLPQAKLDEGIPVSFVRLDELKAYTGVNATALVKPLQKFIFPIAIGTSVRSSVVVEKIGERWQTTRVGAPAIARAYSQARTVGAVASATPAASYFAVEVPALNAYFVARRSDGNILLSSVFDDPALLLRKGEEKPADAVFAILAPVAKQYNGLPR